MSKGSEVFARSRFETLVKALVRVLINDHESNRLTSKS